MLLSAISGGTDERLADELGISSSTVKNLWRSIYNRADSLLSELNPDLTREDGRIHERGKEKRRALIAYLRDHLEELRPVSRKFLQGSGAPGKRKGNSDGVTPASRRRFFSTLD